MRTVVYLMVGIPGSGKSTWCKENHPELPIVSRDIIRAQLGLTKSADEKAVLSKEQEQKVTEVEYEMMKKLLGNKQSFIIDDTNINGKFRANLIEFLHTYDAFIIGVELNTPLSVCIERRKGQISAEVMQSIFNKRIALKPEEVDGIIEVDRTKTVYR